jgi:hypothetical protein
MRFWPGAEPQVWSFTVRLDANNRATTAELRRVRFREVLFDQHPAVAVTEESELIDIRIFVKWPDRTWNRFVWHTSMLADSVGGSLNKDGSVAWVTSGVDATGREFLIL